PSRDLQTLPARRSSDLRKHAAVETASRNRLPELVEWLPRFLCCGESFDIAHGDEVVHKLQFVSRCDNVDVDDVLRPGLDDRAQLDRKSTRLNSSHVKNS